MEGQYDISELKKAIDLLEKLGEVVKDAFNKDYLEGLTDIIQVAGIYKSNGLDLKKAGQEISDLQGMEQIDLLNYLQAKSVDLGLPALQANLVKGGQLLIRAGVLIEENVVFGKDAVAFVNSIKGA